MATIPVEKKASTPIWIWLLPLLLVGALLAYFLTRDTDDDRAAADTAGQADTVDTGAVYSDTADGFDGAMSAADSLAAGMPVAGTAGAQAAGAQAAGAQAADAPAADGGVAASGAAILSLADLDRAIDGSATGGSLDGRPVRLSDARVTSVVGDSAFYVGTGADRVLVILANVGEAEAGAGGSDGVFNVDEGDLVGLTGELKGYARGMRGMSQLEAADQARVGTRGYVVVTRPNGLTQLAK